MQENGNRNTLTSPGFLKGFENLSEDKRSRRKAKWKNAKLKVSELPSAKIPSKCKVFAVLWENLNMMVT